MCLLAGPEQTHCDDFGRKERTRQSKRQLGKQGEEEMRYIIKE